MKKNTLTLFILMFSQFFLAYLNHNYAQAIEHNFEKLSVVVPNCVIQDKFGFIWVGSQGGLLRYDGYKFKHYSHIPFDSTSISSDFVSVIKEDKIGNLWIGTNGGGLNYFDRRLNKFISFKDTSNKIPAFERSHITDIEINIDGSLWIATHFKGLVNFRNTTNLKSSFKKYPLNKKLTSTEEYYILDLYKDKEGKLWVGTFEQGLIVLDPTTNKIKQYINNPEDKHSLSCNTVSSICEDDFGNIWIGTGSNNSYNGMGINRFNKETKRFAKYMRKPQNPKSLYSNNISSLIIDKKNTMWIGTVGKGITSISVKDLLENENPEFKFYKNLSSGVINSLYEDKTGKIWISTWDFYVRIYDPNQNQFAWYRKHEEQSKKSLSSSTVRSLYIDKKGRYWFGTRGLDMYAPTTFNFTHYFYTKEQNSLASNWVMGMCEDTSGYFWFATNGGGLNRFNPVTEKFVKIMPKPNGVKAPDLNIISYILPSLSGNIWIVLPKSGLWLFDISKYKISYIDITSSALEKLSIKSLFEEPNGKLWVGTLNDGLYGLTMKGDSIESVEHYIHNNRDPNSLTVNNAVDIIRPEVVDTNALWIATTVGLNRLDLKTKKISYFFMEDGLPNNFTLKILEDNSGNIWVATAIGLGKYDVLTKTIQNFTVADGLPFPGFGGGKQNAAKTKNGQLFFSGGSGAIGFYPERMKIHSTIPPVILTDFKIYHKSVQLDTSIQFIKKINLEYSQNTFSIEFVALNYKNSKKNQYSYMLKGFHKKWVRSGTERIASFTNIEPGKYIFKVKGSNNLNIWNEKGTSVIIIIAPPWWQTWWFRIIVGIVLVFGIIMIYITKIHSLEKERKRQALFSQKLLESQESERKRIAGELHDSLGQNLLIIYNLIQQYFLKIKNVPPELAQVAPEVKETIEEVRKISRNLHPHQLEQLGLTKSIQSIVKKASKVTNINFVEHIDFIDSYIDNELWIHIYRIIQETLSNIIKHSKAEEGSVEIIRDLDRILITIKDNGIGIKQLQYGVLLDKLYGFGLESIKERVRLLNAKLNILSTNNTSGTIITIEIPI